MKQVRGAHAGKIVHCRPGGSPLKNPLAKVARPMDKPRPLFAVWKNRMTVSRYSSGDRIADRRADYAAMLWDMGDRHAAIDLLVDALALAPGWAPGWFRLGEMREETGDLAGAAGAWTEALRLDPPDRMGASLKLGLIGAAQGIEAAPAAFVEALFDQYADRFDVSLVEKLGYFARDDAARRRTAEAGWQAAHSMFASHRVAQYILERSFDEPLSETYPWPTAIETAQEAPGSPPPRSRSSTAS
jgi:tetratricopeptide (TPR) repeat protein